MKVRLFRAFARMNPFIDTSSFYQDFDVSWTSWLVGRFRSSNGGNPTPGNGFDESPKKCGARERGNYLLTYPKVQAKSYNHQILPAPIWKKSSEHGNSQDACGCSARNICVNLGNFLARWPYAGRASCLGMFRAEHLCQFGELFGHS